VPPRVNPTQAREGGIPSPYFPTWEDGRNRGNYYEFRPQAEQLWGK